MDGSEGSVFEGKMDLVMPELPKTYYELMKWADSFRRLGVRTNADTPHGRDESARNGR